MSGTLPSVIGVAGRARAGKTTIAQYIADRHGYTIIAFGDALKAMAYDIDPCIDQQPGMPGLPNEPWHLRAAVNAFGWEKVKDRFPEARRFLQRLGTEGVRQHIGDDTWITLWIRKTVEVICGGGRVVVPDVRFPNELAIVHSMAGGQVWGVTRPDVEALPGGHVSERPLEPDWWIYNNRDRAYMYQQVDELLAVIPPCREAA